MGIISPSPGDAIHTPGRPAGSVSLSLSHPAVRPQPIPRRRSKTTRYSPRTPDPNRLLAAPRSSHPSPAPAGRPSYSENRGPHGCKHAIWSPALVMGVGAPSEGHDDSFGAVWRTVSG